jgi:outer membrane protein OmpA-like peptidoglycan-associated protein
MLIRAALILLLLSSLPAAGGALTPPPERIEPIMTQTVYFDDDSVVLTPEARAGLDGLLVRIGDRHVEIRIAGHSDAARSTGYSVGLSRRMAEAVRGHLIAGGVAPAAIALSAHGWERPAIPTLNGAREPLNRRVEVVACLETCPAN